MSELQVILLEMAGSDDNVAHLAEVCHSVVKGALLGVQ